MAVFASGPRLPEPVMLGIAQHHERINGSGYPKGLEGPKISVYGKMAAIADSFAALITPRAYANAQAPQDALMNLYEWSGTSFHEPMVEAFVHAVGVFPVGSLADISNSGTLFAFFCVAIGVMVLRRTDPGRHRPFRTPAYMIVCPLAAAGCVFLFFQLSGYTEMLFAIWAAIGLVVYFLYSRRRSHLGRGIVEVVDDIGGNETMLPIETKPVGDR